MGEPSFTFCATLRPVPGLGKGVQLRRPRTRSQAQGHLDTGPWHCWPATELVPGAAFTRGHKPGGGSPAWGGWGSPRVLGLAAPHPAVSEPLSYRLSRARGSTAGFRLV